MPDLAVEQSLVAALAAGGEPDGTLLGAQAGAPAGAASPAAGAGPGMLVAGMDEVGRGALAGPVSVGVVVVRLPDAGPAPAVRDSKALSAVRRTALVPEILAWGAAAAVGHAEPGEIDRYGITAALALAGRRAWHRVVGELGRQPDALVLDGRDDWLPRAPHAACTALVDGPGRVHLQVKADTTCATVAAASILAKVERDGLMTGLAQEHPAYGWDGNKGYGAAVHRQAIAEFGPSPHHRLSWRLLPQQQDRQNRQDWQRRDQGSRPVQQEGQLDGQLEGRPRQPDEQPVLSWEATDTPSSAQWTA